MGDPCAMDFQIADRDPTDYGQLQPAITTQNHKSTPLASLHKERYEELEHP